MNLDITTEEVLTWETKKLWNTINTIKNHEDAEINDEEINKTKNGINIECPIWYFTEEWYDIYPSSKKVKIRGHGKYSIKEFMKEKENRDSIMRKIIIKNIEQDEIIEGRV